jgi:folate-dependent tRNA-U54 methylase TrmFO/GidA
MSDDETQEIAESESAVAYGRHTHFDMDDAFCACMRKAIAAGRESAPIGVVTTPGTKNPKYVPTQQVAQFRQDNDFGLLIKLVQG